LSSTEDLIRITWSGSSAKYVVEYQLDGQNAAPVSKTVSTPFFEIKNPGCNTCYEFKIRCLNDDNSCPDNGTPSAPIKVTTQDCCQHPGNLEKPAVIMTA